jgi:hypothetical protein
MILCSFFWLLVSGCLTLVSGILFFDSICQIRSFFYSKLNNSVTRLIPVSKVKIIVSFYCQIKTKVVLLQPVRGVAQLASVLAWGASGRPFESDHPD